MADETRCAKCKPGARCVTCRSAQNRRRKAHWAEVNRKRKQAADRAYVERNREERRRKQREAARRKRAKPEVSVDDERERLMDELDSALAWHGSYYYEPGVE